MYRGLFIVFRRERERVFFEFFFFLERKKMKLFYLKERRETLSSAFALSFPLSLFLSLEAIREDQKKKKRSRALATRGAKKAHKSAQKSKKKSKKKKKNSYLLRSVSIRSRSLPVCLASSLNSSSLVLRISLR